MVEAQSKAVKAVSALKEMEEKTGDASVPTDSATSSVGVSASPTVVDASANTESLKEEVEILSLESTVRGLESTVASLNSSAQTLRTENSRQQSQISALQENLSVSRSNLISANGQLEASQSDARSISLTLSRVENVKAALARRVKQGRKNIDVELESEAVLVDKLQDARSSLERKEGEGEILNHHFVEQKLVSTEGTKTRPACSRRPRSAPELFYCKRSILKKNFF